VVACFLALAGSVLATDRPVVGILTQPGHGGHYIAASYVKYLESAGARVVPVAYTSTPATIDSLFSGLNGFLFPGGSADLSATSPFFKVANQIYSLAIAAAAKNDVFPLWGTCLGFELINILVAGDHAVLGHGFDSENLPLPLKLTPAANSSLVFRGMLPAVFNAIASQPITMNNHVAGVTPDVFAKNAKLSAMFNVLSTNVDRKGKEFISTIEAKSLPIWGSQWHPEKNPFEWNLQEQLPHSFVAIQAAQHTANFFVNECRQSKHAFASESALEKLLIYNFNPVYTAKSNSTFEQCYVF